MKVTIQCRSEVSCTNTNAEFTKEQWADYKKACDDENSDYFQWLAESYCQGPEYEHDWEIDTDSVEVTRNKDQTPAT